ncbi:MAG TPA: glycolate oxidase subunit GlcE [Geminicoccaceae bacterium]|nr:glycolate oxidase subunit GlcE [Geminicoccaceae bacterium]
MAREFRPDRAEALKEIVAGALADRTPLEVVGGGSKAALGRPLDLPRLRVDGLSGIGAYEPEELVLTAAAGTPMAEIEARLADNRQQLAFEPADYGALLSGKPGQGTIGGVLACNLSGPRRIKAGAARDHFLGVQAVTGRGDLIKAGGRVVKNVTGYDLCKLLAGSFGTLAVMTEVSVKVLPAAEETLTLLLGGLGPADGLGALRTAMASAYDVSGAAYLPPAAAARSGVAPDAGIAALRLEGPGASLRHRADALKDLLRLPGAEIAELDTPGSRTLWREVRNAALLPAGVLWRLSVPPDAAAALLEALAQLRPHWLADWAGGLIWLAPDATAAELPDGGAGAIRSALALHGGHATLIRGDADLRGRIDVFQPQPGPLARLSARVKESFDPEHVLNPGRMYRDL